MPEASANYRTLGCMAETVGERIQRLARERGLASGKALAQSLGVQYESLRQWTAGITAPSRKRVEVIAAYLGVSPVLVMHGEPRAALAPDAEAIAAAFDALPYDTAEALERRRMIYITIMGVIAGHIAAVASKTGRPPAAQPNASPAQGIQTRP